VLLSALAVLATGATLAGDLALGRLVVGWRDAVRLVGVLRDPAPRPGGAEGLVASVRAMRGVAAVRYVAPDAALRELRALLGPRGEGLDRLPANPVPARLEVTPARELDAAGVRALLAELERVPAVEEVQAAVGWLDPVERLGRGLRRGGLALAACLGLAALGAVAATNAAARRAAAAETAILRLAGASEARVALPLVLQAAGLGGLGALLGLGLLLLGSEPAAPWVGDWLRTVLGLEPLPLLPGRWLAALGGGGAALGLLAGLAAGRP
jgi:cell division protein FtsX